MQNNYRVVYYNYVLCLSRRIHDSPWLCMVEACYDNFVTTINRALPVCIAVYRWGALVSRPCHVPRVQVLPRVPRPHPHVPRQQEAAAAGAAGLHARWAVNEPSRTFPQFHCEFREDSLTYLLLWPSPLTQATPGWTPAWRWCTRSTTGGTWCAWRSRRHTSST